MAPNHDIDGKQGAGLTVAVIHYQTPDLLERCLQRLETAAPGSTLLVVDTGEREPLPREWPQAHPDVTLLRHSNHSYSAAVNAALGACETPRFAQMNADVLVEEDTFIRLEEALRASGAAMAGPLARGADGRLQRNGLPYRWHQWLALRGRGWHIAPWLSGCIQYLRMDAVAKVGGMDTSLRFYNEDLEWCLRLRAAGEKCVLVATEVVHLGGASTPKSATPIIEGLRGGYVLSRRYRGPVGRAVHRWGVATGAGIAGALSSAPEKRLGYLTAARMLWRNEVDESPYGNTLSTENPRFLRGGRAE